MEKRAVAFRDIGHHPFGRQIGNRVRRRRVARLHQKPRLRVAGCNPPGDRAGHHQRGVNLARGDDAIDFGLRLAKYADGIPGRFEGAFRRLLIGSRLLDLAFGNSVGPIQVFGAR